MPVLKDYRVTKEISLPSFPDSKVEIFDSLLVGQMANFDQAEKNQIVMSMKLLPKFIKSWNFTDESGATLEINEANIGFLKEADAVYLFEQITQFAAESKKKQEISQQ